MSSPRQPHDSDPNKILLIFCLSISEVYIYRLVLIKLLQVANLANYDPSEISNCFGVNTILNKNIVYFAAVPTFQLAK